MSQLTVNSISTAASAANLADNAPTIPPRGLDVIFGGVEVFEVRSRLVGWRKGLMAAGLAAAVIATVGVWAALSAVPSYERTAGELRNGVVVTGLAALYAICAARRTGAVWRFDHKRKTITRRHWLRGLTRSWTKTQVANVRLTTGRSPLFGDTAYLGLVDATGQVVVELGRWDQRGVDLAHVETVLGEIKKVMWWK